MADLNAGNPEAAEPLLRALHARLPGSFAIDESLGLIYAGQGQLDTALPLLVDAAREQPDSDVAHANLGTAYLKLNRVPQAAKELEVAAKLKPSNPSTQVALGQAYMLLKEPRKAALAFNTALPADPSNPDLLYNTALALFQSGEAATAEPLLARMPGVEDSAPAQSLYGDVDEQLKKFKEAGNHYARAVALAPTEANVYMLGIEFLRHWTFDPAAKEFAAGLNKFPDSTRLRLGLAVAYYGAAQYDKAIPLFASLLAEHPDNEMYAEMLGRNCTVLTEGVTPQCSALVAFSLKHPRNAELATYTAISILHRPSDPTQLELADRLLEQAIRANPDLPQARYAMGLLLQTRSQWQQSIPELETAIRLKPDYASAHYRLALAYSHVGQRDKAQAEIALNQKYSQQENAETDARLKSVTTFMVTMR